jgi:PAS domain-containing protein
MAAYAIEIILTRQLADCLSMPVFITDTIGNLIFYNEPAEELLGKRFEETGEMPVEMWATEFFPMDDFSNIIPPEELPLVKTLKNCHPYYKTFWIRSLQGIKEKISVTSYPIIGREKKFVGAVAIFWKEKVE